MIYKETNEKINVQINNQQFKTQKKSEAYKLINIKL